MKKRYIKKLILLALASFFFLSTASATAIKPPQEPVTSQKSQQKTEPPMYLFVQSAKKAKIELIKNEKSLYKITLKHVNPYVTYFTERPQRIANSMPMEQFLKIWDQKGKESFESDAPNADFNGVEVGFLSPDKPLNAVFELSKPLYDSKEETLTYTAKPLEGSTMPIPNSATLEHVILFIDDACLSCW